MAEAKPRLYFGMLHLILLLVVSASARNIEAPTAAPIIPVARGAVVRELNLLLKPLSNAQTPAEVRAVFAARVAPAPSTPEAFAARAAIVEALAIPAQRPALAQSLRAAGGRKAEKAAVRLEQVAAVLKDRAVRPAVALHALFDGASAAPGESVELSAIPTVAGGPGGKKARKKLAEENERIRELQERLVAEDRRSYLEMIQAIDTAGKDGVVKHGHQVNPAWTEVYAFKKPTAEEAAEDYKARITRRLPARRHTGVHIRTIYEDIISPLLFQTHPPAVVEARFADILRWERERMASGVTLRKVFLHITKEVQRERLQARIDDPEKHWKFDVNDLKTRELWDQIQAIYGRVLARTSTVYAPWEIIGSDDKDARNLAYAKGTRKRLERMDPRYPVKPELAGLKVPK